MADWKGHLIGGFIISGAFIYLASRFFPIDIPTIVLATIVILLGSLLPDCDHDSSKINNILEILSAVLAGYGLLAGWATTKLVEWNAITPELKDIIAPPNLITFGIIMLILTVMAAHYAKHRGRIHSIPAGLIYAFIVSMILFKFNMTNLFVGAVAFIAYWSHLAIDGIPLKCGRHK